MIAKKEYLEKMVIVACENKLLCPTFKVPMKPLYDKMACFKCMTHTP